MSYSFCEACSSFLPPLHACSSPGLPSSSMPESKARKSSKASTASTASKACKDRKGWFSRRKDDDGQNCDDLGRLQLESKPHSTQPSLKPSKPSLKRRASKWALLGQQSQTHLPRYFADAVQDEPAGEEEEEEEDEEVSRQGSYPTIGLSEKGPYPQRSHTAPASLTNLGLLLRHKTSGTLKHRKRTPQQQQLPLPSPLGGLVDFKGSEGGDVRLPNAASQAMEAGDASTPYGPDDVYLPDQKRHLDPNPPSYFAIPVRSDSTPLVSSAAASPGYMLHPSASHNSMANSYAKNSYISHPSASHSYVSPDAKSYADIHPALRPIPASSMTYAKDSKTEAVNRLRSDSRPAMASSVTNLDDLPSALDFSVARTMIEEPRRGAVEVEARSHAVEVEARTAKSATTTEAAGEPVYEVDARESEHRAGKLERGPKTRW